MTYEIDNKYNTSVLVKDRDIDAYIDSDDEIPREIIQAMGKTCRENYLQYLYPVLYHKEFYMRSDAAQSIFNINGSMGLQELKKREAMLDEADLKREPSEKAMLKAMIFRIEKGPEEVKRFFLSDDGYEIVKFDTPFCYRSGYRFQEEDIDILCFVLEQSQRKTTKWLRGLSKSDYDELIYFTLDSICIAGEETDIFKKIDSLLSERIYAAVRLLLEQRINNDCKELIAELPRYMEWEQAKGILRLLRNNVKGYARGVYKKTLKLMKIEESEL